ncbi:MAG: fructosamine kinase family protein [Salibacteraceae bacterium]
MNSVNFYEVLIEALGPKVALESVHRVAGGDINETYCLTTTIGLFFAKVNKQQEYPGMFKSEKKGLDRLSASDFQIPEVIYCAEQGQYQILLMEWMESGQRDESFWTRFARSLSSLHQLSSDSFGLDHNNYIGTIPQVNYLMSSWTDFFVEQRIMPLLKKIRDAQVVDIQETKRVESIMQKLQSFFPDEPPALLHGDLWAGNFMVDESGRPVVFDPAIYYGHRYMDLGMMQLFGGFDQAVFDTYNDCYPLDREWRHGTQVANLYPLLVHVLLFGRSYWPRVDSIVRSL